MTPYFDQNCNVAFWVRDDRYVFDKDLNWVAFIRGGHAFSAHSHVWLGTFENGWFSDTDNRAVAFSRERGGKSSSTKSTPSSPATPSTPSTPSVPSVPARPSVPSVPSGGWSRRSISTLFGN